LTRAESVKAGYYKGLAANMSLLEYPSLKLSPPLFIGMREEDVDTPTRLQLEFDLVQRRQEFAESGPQPHPSSADARNIEIVVANRRTDELMQLPLGYSRAGPRHNWCHLDEKRRSGL
jgi:hypothetical protein